jgi:hypothetical protein
MAKFFRKLGEVANDVVTIDVVTLTGQISFKDLHGVNFTPEGFYEKLKAAQATADSTDSIEVVALTHKEVTFDDINFIAPTGGNITPEMKQMHLDLVATAMDSRQAFFDLIGDAVGDFARLALPISLDEPAGGG